MILRKKLNRISFSTLLILGIVVACSQAAPAPTSPAATVQASQSAPKIVLSGTRIPFKGFVDVKGSGFTPKGELISHLKKPNGAEYRRQSRCGHDSGTAYAVTG